MDNEITEGVSVRALPTFEKCRALLTGAEYSLLRQFLTDNPVTSPKFKDYEALARKLERPVKRKQAAAIPGVRLLPETTPPWIRPLVVTTAKRLDLPRGVGLYPIYDSLGSLAVMSAGVVVATHMWNFHWGRDHTHTRIALRSWTCISNNLEP